MRQIFMERAGPLAGKVDLGKGGATCHDHGEQECWAHSQAKSLSQKKSPWKGVPTLECGQARVRAVRAAAVWPVHGIIAGLVPHHLSRQYRELKELAAGDLGGAAVATLIGDMAQHARKILDGCELVDLISRVPSKTYFGFRGTVESRPVNVALFVHDPEQFSLLLETFQKGMPNARAEEITRTAYTIALSVFAAHDVNDVGRKASATFFEILIGHMVARALDVSPRKKVRMPESQVELPTDYVFDPGRNRRKIHLPIKTSTRERGVQAWVHHLILDGVFGKGRFRGVLVVCGETKRNARTREVIEICVPAQWQMFQERVSELSRIYYLDPPEPYLALTHAHPQVVVKPFGEAFDELRELLAT